MLITGLVVIGLCAAVVIAFKCTTRVGRQTQFTFNHDFSREDATPYPSEFFTHRDPGDES